MRRDPAELSIRNIHHHHSRQNYKLKETIKSRELDTISLNHSELKHLHAIKPYCPKHNKNHSAKHHQSPFEMSRSKSRRLDGSGKKGEEGVGGKKMGDMLTELLHLKSEYKALKRNYDQLLGEKAQ